MSDRARERLLRGVPASPGLAHGRARRLDPAPDAAPGSPVPEAARGAERDLALAALEAAATELDALADRLTAENRRSEAEIVATGALMARDPALAEAVARAANAGRPAAAALVEAAAELAAPLLALEDPTLALRADDLRSVGRRAARQAAGRPAAERGRGRTILVAADLGPADVAELDASVAGVALGAGGVTAHAAIVARSLGLPLVVGAGEELADIPDGASVLVDGGDGLVVVDPSPERVAAAARVRRARAAAGRRARHDRELPAATRDGRRIRVLANVASRPEVDAAL
ncbi:MAG TPA: PEP-utilizing enzyme, partial [Candidatus Dormibacteraeota bacterium]